MKQGQRTVVWVLALLASMFVYSLAHAQPAPIADSFARHRPVLSCPGAGSTHDYEQCAFEFMRRVACDHQADIALWPKNGGTFCTHNGRGYDCDKLVVLASGEMFDVVSSAGIASQSPTWNRVATGVFGGTVTAPSCAGGPSGSTMALGEAANAILAAFDATHHRPLQPIEIESIAAYASAGGWDGSERIPIAVVTQIVTLVQRYSGNVADPFPMVSLEDAIGQADAKIQAKFDRPIHAVEISAFGDYARSLGWNGQGGIPLWILTQVLVAVDAYDGSLVAGAPDAIDPLAEPSFAGGAFMLGGTSRHWDGITAFILQYDWFHDRGRYHAFVDGAQAGGVKTMRVGIAVGTGYLDLRPRSGGTFGMGRSRALYPGDGVFSWDGYRAMVADLNRRGFLVEIVPFLTIGAHNTDGRGGAARANQDRSVPQAMTETSRVAYVQEAARELLPVRAATVEIANEYEFIGFHRDGLEIDRLALAYKAIDPARQVTTSAYHPRWGDYRTMHMDRMTTPRSWSWVINQLRFPRPGLYTINDEGINGDHVGEFGTDATPANHWANGVLSRLVPGFGYTFHYDRALKGLPPSAHDGSLQAITAWRDGTRAVPDAVTGAYVALPNVLGADAAVARLGDVAGWLLLIGATVAPSIPDWTATFVDGRGPHRLYRLTRNVR